MGILFMYDCLLCRKNLLFECIFIISFVISVVFFQFKYRFGKMQLFFLVLMLLYVVGFGLELFVYQLLFLKEFMD